MSGPFGLVLAVLATWRLSHLVAAEDGPFDLIARLRRAAGEGTWGRLMDCPYCLSLWFALPFAAAIAPNWPQAVLYWLAISGGGCLAERATEPRDPPPTEIVLPPSDGDRDVLL